MSSVIKKIRTKLYLPSLRKSLDLLDGSYRSVRFGRSLDFEDLREYQPGDSVKDIDWKRSAKSERIFIKQHRVDKQLPVFFVLDAGKSMQALDNAGEKTRSDLVVEAAGILGHIVLKHGDRVGSVLGDQENSIYFPVKSTESNLENILTRFKEKTNSTSVSVSNVENQIDFFLKLNTQRSLVVIFSSYSTLTESLEKKIGLLNKKHTLFWVNIEDSNPINASKFASLDQIIVDVETGETIPAFISLNKKFKLNNFFAGQEEKLFEEVKKFFVKNNISYCSIKNSEETIPSIIRLLNNKRRVR